MGPRRALQFCRKFWSGQAKKAVAEKTAAEEAEKVPSCPLFTNAVSVALRATHTHGLIGNNVFVHT